MQINSLPAGGAVGVVEIEVLFIFVISQIQKNNFCSPNEPFVVVLEKG